MTFTKQDTKIMKGVAICLMLYHHLFAYPNKIMDGITYISLYTLGETTFSTYIGQFGRICLPMFVFLSGYGCYLSASKRPDLQKLLLRQILGLYQSFWKVFLVFVPLSIVCFSRRPQPLQRELIYNFLGLSYTFNEEWWFIVPYVLLLLIFPIVKRYLDRSYALLPTDLLFLFFMNAFIVYVLPELCRLSLLQPLCASVFWNHTKVMLGLLPGFILGCIFAKYALLDQIKTHCAGKLPWCLAALLGIAALFYIHLYNYMFYDYINTALFIICLLILLPTRPGRLIGALMEKLGEESTFMWLTHSFYCYYWCQKLVFSPRYAIAIFVFLLAMSYISAKLLRHFWNFLTQFLTKSRKAKSVV